MPDSPEYRISQLEQAMSAVRQRTDDHETDIRSFAPLVVAHAQVEVKLAGIQLALDALRKDWREDVEHFDKQVRDLNAALEVDRKDRDRMRREREEREHERERKDRRYRIATWIAAVGMAMTFVSTTVGVLALVIT
jgi:chromosome segregation ATPase